MTKGCTCVLVLNCITLTPVCHTHSHTPLENVSLSYICLYWGIKLSEASCHFSYLLLSPPVTHMKKSIYFHLSKPFTPEREKTAVSAILCVCVCVYMCTCACVSGGCGAMLEVIMKRLKCDRRFLWLGIKHHLIYLNKPHCDLICTHSHTLKIKGHIYGTTQERKGIHWSIHERAQKCRSWQIYACKQTQEQIHKGICSN